MADETDELYALGQDEFTAARDALAKRLRADKQKEEADAVKKLRRPSVAAWAVNQAARSDPDGLRELLAAGKSLRVAHEALMAGEGDAEEVRGAGVRERDAVRALSQRAAEALGGAASEATLAKVRETLHAAAADEQVRERLEAGRIEREAEGGVTGWGFDGAGAQPAAETPAKSPSEPKPRARAGGAEKDASAARKERAAEKQREATAREERRARETAAREREAEETAAAAETAEREAERAGEAGAAAEKVAQEAREALEEAERAARGARRAIKEAEAEAERRRTEARRAAKAARR